MAVEIEVISKEMIKPSSPTPEHLRRYSLSFLDQVTVDVYNPMIYFYSPVNNGDATASFNATQISDQLKESLSRFLIHFYPLAGRANYTEFFIDCNDSGVPFVEARVNCRLSDVIETAYPAQLNKFLPFVLDELNDVSMGVQVNEFECGGVGVGICISHKISDALSFFIIASQWAAFCRGESNAVHPHFTSSELFPPMKTAPYNTRNSIFRQRVARRYEIDASSTEAIRAKYAESPDMENQRRPSRVESLSAFLYGRFIATSKDVSSSNDNESSESEKTYLVCHAVNIRSRLDPPVPEYAFGNYYRTSMAVPSPDILNDEYCYGLVRQVREEISKVNKEYLKMLQQNDKFVESMKKASARFAAGELISCSFTSLSRMPSYEADFGWGKPVWVGSPALIFKNLFVLLDKKDGDGLEVYIHLKEEHMAKLEADEEFLKYVKLPSSASAGLKP